MTSRRPALSRRTLLKGLAHGGLSAAIGLPLLEAMLDNRALAQSPPPKAFGIFFWANGVRKERWVPTRTGTSFDLSEELAPLSAVKDYLTVVSGFEVKDKRFGHHCATAGMLSGLPCIDQSTAPGGANERSTFAGPSLDVIVSRRWEGQTRLRSLEYSALRNTYDEGTTYDQLSHNGPNNVNPAELSPQAAFDRLFGVRDPNALIRAARASVLDVVAADTRALKAKLGAVDRARMDQHLEHLRALERQLQADEGPRCVAPARPANQPPTGANLVARFQAFAELIAVALACDVTRVFSIRLTCPADNTVLGLPGITSGSHDLTHNEGGAQPQVHRTVVFSMEQLAHLLGRLKATTDPLGRNLLDRLALLGTSDCQLGLDHDNTDFPILLAGRASGALRTGLHHRSTTAESSTKVLITLLKALDMPVATFGAGPLLASESVPALLA